MQNLKQIIFDIAESMAGLRLDKALALHESIGSRTRAQELIVGGFVSSDMHEQNLKPSLFVKHGEVYIIRLPEKQEANLKPLDLELDILFEDDDIIVVNKPAGLVVHPALGHAQDTLVNALVNYTDKLSMGFGETRPGIVHRLDRDTSGVLVVARNDQAHQRLSQQFKDRSISRTYWAIVIGHPQKSQGHIESYIARDSKDRKKFSSSKVEQGKWAATNFRVLEKSAKNVALLELKLETGRTHQIRVHVSEMGYPILGDTLYAGRHPKKLGSELTDAVERSQRFALHATELGFTHPTNGTWLDFKVSWPQDLAELVQICEFNTR